MSTVRGESFDGRTRCLKLFRQGCSRGLVFRRHRNVMQYFQYVQDGMFLRQPLKMGANLLYRCMQPRISEIFLGTNFSFCTTHISRQLSSNTHRMTQLSLPTSKFSINLRDRHTSNSSYHYPRCVCIPPRIESRDLDPVETLNTPCR